MAGGARRLPAEPPGGACLETRRVSAAAGRGPLLCSTGRENPNQDGPPGLRPRPSPSAATAAAAASGIRREGRALRPSGETRPRTAGPAPRTPVSLPTAGGSHAGKRRGRTRGWRVTSRGSRQERRPTVPGEAASKTRPQEQGAFCNPGSHAIRSIRLPAAEESPGNGRAGRPKATPPPPRHASQTTPSASGAPGPSARDRLGRQASPTAGGKGGEREKVGVGKRGGRAESPTSYKLDPSDI